MREWFGLRQSPPMQYGRASDAVCGFGIGFARLLALLYPARDPCQCPPLCPRFARSRCGQPQTDSWWWALLLAPRPRAAYRAGGWLTYYPCGCPGLRASSAMCHQPPHRRLAIARLTDRLSAWLRNGKAALSATPLPTRSEGHDPLHSLKGPPRRRLYMVRQITSYGH